MKRDGEQRLADCLYERIVTYTASELEGMAARGDDQTDQAKAALVPLPDGSDPDDAMEEVDWATAELPCPAPKPTPRCASTPMCLTGSRRRGADIRQRSTRCSGVMCGRRGGVFLEMNAMLENIIKKNKTGTFLFAINPHVPVFVVSCDLPIDVDWNDAQAKVSKRNGDRGNHGRSGCSEAQSRP